MSIDPGLQDRVGNQFATFEPSLSGTSEAVSAAWRALSHSVTALSSGAATAAEQVSKLQAESVDLANRGGAEASALKAQEAAAAREAALAKVSEGHALSTGLYRILESRLEDDLKPKTSPDPTNRLLARQLIDVTVAGARGADAAARLLPLVARGDPAVDAELLEERGYGHALIADATHWRSFRAQSLVKLMAAEGTTQRQKSAAAALLELRSRETQQRSLKGHLDLARTLARQRIGGGA